MRSVQHILIILLSYIGCHLYAQEFSFQMKFEDAIGNVDTLILGYDIAATDSIDPEFGEINIIDENIDSIFDVRVTDEWSARGWWFDSTGNYHLKKQILKKNCGPWPTTVSIDIKCNNWPVTAYWDSSLFDDICRKGSVLTSVPPGGWWDVGSPSDLDRVLLLDKSSVSFTANWEGDFNSNYAYINEDQDTISVFWIAICDISHLLVNVDELDYNESFRIFPNPAKNQIFIDTRLTKLSYGVEIYSLMGKLQSIDHQDNIIDVSRLKEGVYIVRFTTKNNNQIIKKIVKY